MVVDKYKSVRAYIDESVANVLGELKAQELDHYMMDINKPEIDGSKAEKDEITYSQAYELSVYSTLIEIKLALDDIEKGKAVETVYSKAVADRAKSDGKLSELFDTLNLGDDIKKKIGSAEIIGMKLDKKTGKVTQVDLGAEDLPDEAIELLGDLLAKAKERRDIKKKEDKK